jgi:hypothetical protein
VAHILPGAWDSPISCELSIASLNSVPAYQTLSYVWGDPKVTNPILLHGHTFHVTINLYAALRRLRSKKTRVIWIDSLCINQSDTDERNYQVVLMGKIYERCQEVLVWLGERTEIDITSDTKTVEEGQNQLRQFMKGEKFTRDKANSANYNGLSSFAIFHLLSSGRHFKDLPCFVEALGSWWDSPTIFNEFWDHFGAMMRLSYWDRIWVLQEMVLPPGATVIYGSISAQWDILSKATRNIEHHANTCCMQSVFNLPQKIRAILFDFGSKVSQIEQTRTLHKTGPDLDLPWLLRQTLTREATDDRDKVYGLLGLTNNQLHGSSIVPNYRTTSRDVFEALSMQIIRITGSLQFLVVSSVRSKDFPSWIAYWGQKVDQTLWKLDIERNKRYHVYSASKNQKSTAERLEMSLLRLKGDAVDIVSAVGPIMESEDQVDQAYMTCEQIMAMAGLQGDQRQAYSGGGMWINAYWRTLCADSMGGSTGTGTPWRAEDEDENKYELWRAVKQDGKNYHSLSTTEKADLQVFHESVVSATRYRRVFVTESGLLGIGPSDTQIGDCVFVLLGSNVPVVLRKTPSLNEHPAVTISSQPMLRLVGDCFVHGIMDGEAWDSDCIFPLILH